MESDVGGNGWVDRESRPVVNGRFRVGTMIRFSQFGVVYLGTDTFTKQLVEIKLENVNAEYPALIHESEVYNRLKGGAEDHPEILFLKVNFDENKPMCKSMNVKVLPYFHFYRGSEGQLESFSCSLAKFQKLKDAIALHNTARCSIGPPKGVGDIILEPSSAPKDKPSESASS